VTLLTKYVNILRLNLPQKMEQHRETDFTAACAAESFCELSGAICGMYVLAACSCRLFL